MKKLFVSWTPAAAVIAAGLVAGCAVGPDFRTPAAPTVKGYTEGALPAATAAATVGSTAGSTTDGGAAQRFVAGLDIPGQWWTVFRSEPLDRLIRQALADNPSLAAAQATLRQAQETLKAQTGAEYFPAVDAGFSAVRQQVNGASFGQPGAGSFLLSLINASVNVSYSLDFFGGGRRELEGLKAQVEYQRFQLEGAYLTLTANIVTAAVQEASLREQIRATQAIASFQRQQLDLVERRFLLGGAARADVLAQQTQLAQTQAGLPSLEKQLAVTRHLLSALAGRFPGEGGLPQFELSEIKLPLELPVSLPSSLVRQRPDIRASEELFHAAGAQVGVATANLYPKVTLTAGLGSTATKIQDLFAPGSSVWNLGMGLTQPIFHGGELTARRRAAIAAYDQASALYRAAVLQAFQNVADVLRALERDADALRAQAQVEEAAAESLDLARRQYELGAVGYLSLLDAERQRQQASIGLVQARAARYADTAALFQAMGGGWWNRPPATDKESAATTAKTAEKPLTGAK